MSTKNTPPIHSNKSETQSTHLHRLRESQYLDTAQQAIWQAVQNGELEAINVFLKISDRRVKLWGLALEQQNASHDWVVHVEYATPNHTNS